MFKSPFKSRKARILTATATACVAGCVSGPKQRPPPPPADCPPGSAMTHELYGIGGGMHPVVLDLKWGSGNRVRVQEGEVTVSQLGDWEKFPQVTTFFGRFYFGTDRVYARFTKARLPNGDVLPVCLQLKNPGEHLLGMAMAEPETTPSKVFMEQGFFVEAVNRFE